MVRNLPGVPTTPLLVRAYVVWFANSSKESAFYWTIGTSGAGGEVTISLIQGLPSVSLKLVGG